MVTEFRRLVFSPQELQSAVGIFNAEKVSKLPQGKIVDLVVIAEPKLGARVQVNMSADTDDLEVSLDAAYLGAAMLYQCMRDRIPIPKAPKKTVEQDGDGLALVFSVQPEGPAAPPSET